jgi:hypothetical protein
MKKMEEPIKPMRSSEPTEDYTKSFDAEPDNAKKPWMRQTDDETWLVKTKRGIFKLKELDWDRIERAKKRNEKAPQMALLSDSIVGLDGRKFSAGEEEIKTWKGSIVIRLMDAINTIYEIEDFLQD